MSAEADPVVDLGGCGGCGVACAVACGPNESAEDTHVRRSLVATGVGTAALALVPVAVGGGWLATFGVVLVVLGAVVSVLAGVALRSGPGAGERAVRLAYRLLPVAVGGLLASFLAVAGGMLLG